MDELAAAFVLLFMGLADCNSFEFLFEQPCAKPVTDTSKPSNIVTDHWTNSVESEPPQFAATLVPYRSLGRNGFLAVMAFVGFSCFLSGLMFWQMGAWPVVFFMAADVLVIWAAFHFNYRAARGYEEIAVWRHIIHLRKTAPNGRWQSHSFNPYWARFSIDRHDEIGITRMVLTGEGKTVDVGSFLNPADRESFAEAFSRALAKARA